jgi:hypothetical protein
MTPQAGINRVHKSASVVEDLTGRSGVHPDAIKLDYLRAVIGLSGFDDAEERVCSIKELVEWWIVDDTLVKRPTCRSLSGPTLYAGYTRHVTKRGRDYAC